MSSCSEMKIGDVYKCGSCGFEIEVKKACTCGDDGGRCGEIECCGSPMSKM